MGHSVSVHRLVNQAGLSCRQAAEFSQVLEVVRPTIVIYSLQGILRTYPLVAKAHGVGRVYYHDQTSRLETSTPLGGLKRHVSKWMLRGIDGVLAASDYVASRVRDERIISSDKIQTIYSGIDIPENLCPSWRYEWRKKLGITSEQCLIMQCGSLTEEKGVSELLRSFAIVLNDAPGTLLGLVGVGDEAHYRAMAESLGIARQVIWIGKLSSPLHEHVYAAADVYCQLSQWNEAFGFTLAEAMSFALPVVASSKGGIPEIVRANETGFIVNSRDTTKTAAAISALVRNTQLRNDFGRGVRHRFPLPDQHRPRQGIAGLRRLHRRATGGHRTRHRAEAAAAAGELKHEWIRSASRTSVAGQQNIENNPMQSSRTAGMVPHASRYHLTRRANQGHDAIIRMPRVTGGTLAKPVEAGAIDPHVQAQTSRDAEGAVDPSLTPRQA